MKIKKAVIAAAGLGTRFLPQTKAMPKEMLPVIDKPVIQMIVEEAVAAGVEDIIIVTGMGKRAIEDHFDRQVELEQELREKGKDAHADEIKRIAELANFVYVRQKGLPKGNARPVLNASHLIGDEPFFVFFADDFFRAEVPRAKQLLETYEKVQSPVMSLIEVDPKDADKYGMVQITDQVDDNTFRLGGIVEKPKPEESPSNYASVGAYILTPEIMEIVRQEKIGHGGEIGIAHSFDELARSGSVHGRLIDGVYHDAGSKEKYLEAIVDLALANPKIEPGFREYLQKRLDNDPAA